MVVGDKLTEDFRTVDASANRTPTESFLSHAPSYEF